MATRNTEASESPQITLVHPGASDPYNNFPGFEIVDAKQARRKCATGDWIEVDGQDLPHFLKFHKVRQTDASLFENFNDAKLSIFATVQPFHPNNNSLSFSPFFIAQVI